MPFKPGQCGNPKGRPKGAKDKITRDVEKLIWDAVELGGGAQALLKHPDILYGILLPKIMPQKVKQSIDARHTEITADAPGLRLVHRGTEGAAARSGNGHISLPPTGTQ